MANLIRRSGVLRRARGKFICKQQLVPISSVGSESQFCDETTLFLSSGDDRDSEADGLEVRLDGGGGGRVRREGHRLLRGPGQEAGDLHRRQHQGMIEAKESQYFTGTSTKTEAGLHVPVSQLPLATGASSRNLLSTSL